MTNCVSTIKEIEFIDPDLLSGFSDNEEFAEVDTLEIHFRPKRKCVLNKINKNKLKARDKNKKRSVFTKIVKNNGPEKENSAVIDDQRKNSKSSIVKNQKKTAINKDITNSLKKVRVQRLDKCSSIKKVSIKKVDQNETINTKNPLKKVRISRLSKSEDSAKQVQTESLKEQTAAVTDDQSNNISQDNLIVNDEQYEPVTKNDTSEVEGTPKRARKSKVGGGPVEKKPRKPRKKGVIQNSTRCVMHAKMSVYCPKCDKCIEKIPGKNQARCEDCDERTYFQCKACSKRNQNYDYLSKHINNDCGKIKKFACPRCTYRTDRLYILKDHLRCVHEEVANPDKNVAVSCECGRKFKLERYLRFHKKNECGKDMPVYECKVTGCRFASIYVNSYRKHMRFVHCAKDMSKEHICEKCGATFKRYSSLTRHLQLLCGKAPTFECNHCDYKSFVKYSVLARHIQRHHKQDFPEFEFYCKSCEVDYYDYYTLRRHRRICLGEPDDVGRRIVEKDKVEAESEKSGIERKGDEKVTEEMQLEKNVWEDADYTSDEVLRQLENEECFQLLSLSNYCL